MSRGGRGCLGFEELDSVEGGLFGLGAGSAVASVVDQLDICAGGAGWREQDGEQGQGQGQADEARAAAGSRPAARDAGVDSRGRG
ncbi:MAG: hypothetical protein CL908_04295 [Deltaproteobacteria bacterium]|nr:hypothetical protein [Deltaproteobacteria bacterium]